MARRAAVLSLAIALGLLFSSVPSRAQQSQLTDALFVAVSAGDTALISDLVEAGADINARDEDGWTPLAHAAAANEPEAAKLLIKAGASLSASDISAAPPVIAALSGNVQVLDVFLAAGIEPRLHNEVLSIAATTADATMLDLVVLSIKPPAEEAAAFKKKLAQRYGLDFPADAVLDRPVVLAALKACQEEWLYDTVKCLSLTQARKLQPSAGSSAPLQECDYLAAHPDDPDRIAWVQGLPFEKIDAAKAVAVCTSAVERFPTTVRFLNQLARSFGAQKRYPDAVYYYRKAAELGSAHAMALLASYYAEGDGVQKDEVEAARLAAKAADRADRNALSFLGGLYRTGRGVKKNYSTALLLYQKAAAGGVVEAINNLGFMYENGLGVPQDYVEAMRLYRQAAETNEPVSMRNVGLMYEHGRGTPRNNIEAMRWYRMAAEAGNEDARKDLRRLERTGRR